MNSFQLKLTACLLMVIDHVGLIFFPQTAVFRIIGRLSMPLFAFMIGEGFRHTKNLKKYLLTLFLFAILSQPVYWFVIKSGFLNIFFSLFLGLLSLAIYQRSRNKTIALFTVLTISILAFILNIEYGFYGVMMVFLLGTHDVKKDMPRLLALTTLVTLLNISAPFIINPRVAFANISIWSYMQIFAIPSVLIMILYNGKRGPVNKYFFYFFYPAHLLLLSAIKFLI
jgi:hypothetical protein